jgi:hypothetical protein
MALGLNDYASIAALISAFCDVSTFAGITFESAYSKYISDPQTLIKGNFLKNTYSDDELESIRDRIEHCRVQFKETLDGMSRIRCLCFILKQVKIGNGGEIPFADWNKTYNRLNCA